MKCTHIKKQLSAYLDKETSPKESEQIDDHIAACEHCRYELERLDNTYTFINTQAELPFDPYLATRVKAITREKPGVMWRPISAFLYKAVLPSVVFAGLGIGIFLGMQLKHAMVQEQAKVAQQRSAPQHIDENMFTTTPSGSITASYLTLTSARQ